MLSMDSMICAQAALTANFSRGLKAASTNAIGFLPTDSNAIGNAGFLRQLERSKTTWRHSNSNSCLETSRHASQMPDTLQLLSSAY